MLSAKSVRRLVSPAATILLLFCALIAASCSKGADASFIGTFRIGEGVQVGPLLYQVLEAEWRNELGNGGRVPRDRYLFVRLSVTNGGSGIASVPSLTIEGAGKTYAEVTESMEHVDDWLGMLRNIGGSQTEQGWIVFDAPMGPYKLVLSEGEVGDERHAHVDIPVQLE